MGTRNGVSLVRARSQQGAALIIGLILLMVLTLLAVAGMNSASMELIMAGNEQYRQNAFQAAETGIEQAIVLGTFNPANLALPCPPSPINVVGTITGTTDSYTADICTQLGGAPQGALWGNSWNSFSTFHFEIQSAGTSVRGANAANVQGIAVISPWDSTVLPDPSLGSTALN